MGSVRQINSALDSAAAAAGIVGGKHPSLGDRLLRPLGLFLSLFLVGTVGYFLLKMTDGLPLPPSVHGKADLLRYCMYQTAILLTGVGFSDVLNSEQTWGGALFTIIMAFLGLGFLMYFISTITAFIVGGELSQILERKRMEKQIARLQNHFIVCGAGETGRHVISELMETQRPFVLIELDPERVEKIKSEHEGKKGMLYLQADASDDDVLLAAGIDRATGLITTLREDKDNLLVSITARQLNGRLRIISRCVELDNMKKLKKAGADKIVAPNMIGGLRMVSEMIRPSVTTFLDTMLRDQRAIRFEDIRVPAGHDIVGKTLAEAKLYAVADVNIIAARTTEHAEFIYNPRGDLVLRPAMDLVAIGTPEEIRKLRLHVEGTK